VTNLFESQKYKLQYAENPVLNGYPELNAEGSNITLNPLWNPSGLVGYWPLNEGTGTTAYDMSGNGNNGSWNGSTTNGSYYTAGKVGPWAGTFDGSTDAITIGTVSVLNPGTITVAAWIYPKSSSLGTVVARNGPYYLGFGNQFTSVTQKVGVGACAGSCTWNAITGNTTISLNAWSLIALTYDGTTTRAYLNGVQDASLVLSPNGPLTSGGSNLRIGWCDPGMNQYFDGLVDDVRIYNRALSASEVQALYDAER
jgi:hypothetical protein